MEFEYKGRKYEVIFGSDIVRDGVFLELDDITDPKKPEGIMEVFFSDADGSFVFSAWKEVKLPFEQIELFIRGAREQLPALRHLEDRNGEQPRKPDAR